MSVLVCADRRWERRLIDRAIGSRWKPVHTDPERLRIDRPDRAGVEAIVFACASQRLDAHRKVLERLIRQFPRAPVILVVDQNLEAVRSTSGLRLTRIVWFEELHNGSLDQIIEEGLADHGFGAMIRQIQAARLPRLLTRALVRALRAADLPFLSVADLAASVPCSPFTLSHQFHDAVGGEFTFSDFLSALQLVRARQLRSTKPWESAARDIGLTDRSLRRKSQKLFGCNLRDLHRLEVDELLEDSLSRFVVPLTGKAS